MKGRFGPLARRSLLLGGVASLGGCNFLDDLLATSKDKLPGKREPIALLQTTGGVDVTDKRAIVLPSATVNADWPQAGGTPTHVGGSLALSGTAPAWNSSVGEEGGYRARLTAGPVVAGGRVFTMDSDGLVCAFDVERGRRQWRTDTQADKDRSTNVGGGVAVGGDIVYAATGRAELLALNVGDGTVRWRKPLGTPARCAPTLADGRVLVITLDGRLLAFRQGTGDALWSYQGVGQQTNLLGHASPAAADGLVVAGFESGEIVAVTADGGALAWSDNLSASAGRNSLLDLSAIRGLPVIDRGRVYATGQGGTTVSFDLRSGRRLWERPFGGSETPWLAGDWLFVQTVEQVLAAVHRDDGRVRWATEMPRYDNPEKARDAIHWSGPVLAGGQLVLVSDYSRMMSVDPVSGRILGGRDLPDAGKLSPVVAGNTMFVLTDDATLTAYR